MMMKLAFILALLALSPASAHAAGQTAPAAIFGDIQVKCGICHLDRMSTATGQGQVSFRALRREGAGGEGVCYSCHNGLVRDSRERLWERFQHPVDVKPGDPGSIGRGGFSLDERGRLSCGSCHTPHVKGEGIGTFMRFSEEGGAFCRRCHPTRAAGVQFGEHPLDKVEGKSLNRVLAVGGKVGSDQRMVCTTCHKIHGAASPFLLTLQTWGTDGLCQGCHGVNPSRKGSGPGTASHPVNLKVSARAPLAWSRENVALSPAGMVDCWSCHRVHGSTGGSPLLVKEILRGNGCVRCHVDRSSTSRGQGNHPVMAAAGEQGAARRVTCLLCHRAHNGRVGQKSLLTYDPQQSDFCLGCHGEQAVPQRNHPLGSAKESALLGKLAAAGASFGRGREIICASCHRMHGPANGTPALVTQERELCLYCHERQRYLEAFTAYSGIHPMLVPLAKSAAEQVIAAGGRLGTDGELMCTTCHQAHGARGQGKGLVRKDRPLACTLCHQERAAGGTHIPARAPGPAPEGEAGGDIAADPCRACHRVHGWNLNIPDGTENFITRLCLACHGGDGGGATPFPPGVSHPVGVKPSIERGMTSRLPLYLKNGRRFKKGELTCATCHEVHGQNGENTPKLLRLPLAGKNALCAECHAKQLSIVGTKHDLSLSAPGEINMAGLRADQGGVCSPCHLAHGGMERGMWARLVDGEGDPSAQLCRSCHGSGLPAERKVTGPYSHPLVPGQAAASGTMPAQGVRVAQGAVTCTSCHDPHRWNPGNAEARGGAGVEGSRENSFLRWPDDDASSLCRRCHARQFTVAGTEHDMRLVEVRDRQELRLQVRQGSLCGGCHLVHGGLGAYGWPETLAGEGDSVSTECLACHREGGVAADKQPGTNSHPVGIYPAAAAENLPLFEASGRRFKNGILTCATCHDAHLWDASSNGDLPGERAEGNMKNSFLRQRADGRSTLCVTCHARQGFVAGTDHDLRLTAETSANAAGRSVRESGVCGACHAVHRATPAGHLWNRDLGPGPDALSRYCTGCHGAGGPGKKPPRAFVHFQSEYGREITSPTRVFTLRRTTRSDLNVSLPLFTEDGHEAGRGLITCLTCHVPHQWDPSQEMPGEGTAKEGTEADSFLRLKGTYAVRNTFCSDCHPSDTVSRWQRYHFLPEDPGKAP